MSTLFDWVELPDIAEPMLPLVTGHPSDPEHLVTKNTGGTGSMLPLVTTCYHKKHNTCSKSVCVCKNENFTHTHNDSNMYPLGVVTVVTGGNNSANYTCKSNENGVNKGGNSGNMVVTFDHPHWLTELSCYAEYAACTARVEKNGLLFKLWENEGALADDERRLMAYLEEELGAPVTQR